MEYLHGIGVDVASVGCEPPSGGSQLLTALALMSRKEEDRQLRAALAFHLAVAKAMRQQREETDK